LQMIREGGTFCKLLDLMDERRLTQVEAALFAQLLLRGEDEAPLPREPDAFCDEVADRAWDAEPVLDVLRGRMVPPVDAEALRWALGIAGGFRGILRTLAQGDICAALPMLMPVCSTVNPGPPEMLPQL